MPIANVRAEVVLVDDLGHVADDLGGGGDRRTTPWLEAIAERMQVAVRSDARVAMGEPRTAEAFLRVQDDEACSGALLREVKGAADARDSRSNDEDVEVLGPQWGGLG